jgi:agmatine/peptidylarginine deiminase
LNYVFDGQVHYGISSTPVLPDVPYQFVSAQNVLREGGGLHCITANFKIP